MPKVSIIVPVYKVEKYLERCVKTLVKQTLEDIEIILVDDGSPDNCPAMCDEWAKRDSRIKVVHKPNGGLSSARNAGIKVASGKYLGYVDSDDYVDLDYYERMYACAKAKDVDFVMMDYRRVEKTGETKEKSLDIRKGLYTKENMKKEIYPMLIMRECVDYGPLLSVCQCLYRTAFIRDNHLFFDEQVKWSEDCIYSAILGYVCNGFFYMKHESGYNYCQNEGSITTSYKPAAWGVYCLMNEKLRAFFEPKEDFDFSRQLNLHMLYFACSFCSELRYAEFGFWQKYRERKKVLCDAHLTAALKHFKMPAVSLKFKIIIALMKYRCAFLLTLIA